MRVIGVTGMQGAGKSILCGVAAERGIPVVEMGELVLKEMRGKGIAITNESIRNYATELREKHGRDYVARKAAERIGSAKASAVVVCGVRGYAEVQRFRQEYGSGFALVAFFAPQKTRFERVLKRGREGDPKDWQEFAWREEKELALGIAEATALADYMIMNTSSRKQAEVEAKRLLDELLH
jgi:dephospho-CoA kinase